MIEISELDSIKSEFTRQETVCPQEKATCSPILPVSEEQRQSVKVVHENIDVVVQIMKTNVHKVMIRDGKLEELESRAATLEAGASQFKLQAVDLKHVKRDDIWKNNMKGAALLSIPIMFWFITFACKYQIYIFITHCNYNYNFQNFQK